ncbi:MAG: 2-oxoacid:acceptor oxidoreductase subunit alpha [Candidatus Levyibacteriota bacterium]
MTDFQLVIGGEAGYGIMTVGLLLSKAFTRHGLSVFDYTEYPSLIRGGHNAYYVRASDSEIFSQKRNIEILIALNKETVDKHKSELSKNAVIIFDPQVAKIEQKDFQDILLYPVPFLELAKSQGGDKVMINTVAVGAALGILGADFEVLQKILEELFGQKGEKVVLENVNSAKAGFDYAVKIFSDKFKVKIEKKTQENLLINGAEAVSLGAIRAGLKFAAIYPMTPINNILTILVSNASKYNFLIKEPEDEISGINMAIGASYAGARSMVATSGGGFCLMTEALGLSAQIEVPLVIVLGARPGPSSGMPTWTDQGDLQFALHASQGDLPRIVIAPGDMLEAFSQTMQAFNFADKYQLPVIILTDKYLLEGHATVQSSKFKVQSSKFKLERGKILNDTEIATITDYKRYAITDDGISPRSLPGQKGGIALSDSYEHDEQGMYDETCENRIKMVDKRFKKLQMALKDIPKPELFGNIDAQISILAFGSTKMPVLQALKILKDEGLDVNFLKVSFLNPFPAEEVAQTIKKAKKTIVIEGNKSGQFESLIKEQTGLSITKHFRKYDGRPFYPEEIVSKIKDILK